ncbi:hypothetical protein HMPREF1062_01745 [Bacteroides cellulosilyticus CL02T12C19]|uniref:Uncharacterized protein n=1 Tax=Bacteroides cellulosilyticus CL02T12C19 TaxID=997874 RepID=I9QW90_9BACE|nr:hypothetical protein HMPREF1062_01745 [Bacteroides cellulosilyticus CL02T12C19]
MICTTYFLTFFSELIPPTGIFKCSATCLKRIRTVLAPYILRSKVLLHGESTALVRSKCILGMVQTNTFLLY